MAHRIAYLVGATYYLNPDDVPVPRTAVTVTKCGTNIIDRRTRHD